MLGIGDVILNYFLEQVISKNIGGLFMWDYETIEKKYLNTISNVLKGSCCCSCSIVGNLGDI